MLISQNQSVAEAICAIDVTLGGELLNGEIFYTLTEAQTVIESWRRHYDTVRLHGALGYRAPASEVFIPAFVGWPARSAKLSVVERLTVH